MTYQTDNIGWRADYNLTLNAAESASDVGAWVTIRNQSGLVYPDANLKLVAGNVRRLSGRRAPQREFFAATKAASDAVAPQFQEQAFFDYHLYTLQRTTSLANNSTKQIELFPSKTAVPVSKTYVYYGLPDQFRGIVYNDSAYSNRDLGTEMNKQVDVYIQLDNTEKNGMGMPLPAGHVRATTRKTPPTIRWSSSAKTRSITRPRTKSSACASAPPSTSSANAARPTFPPPTA